MSLTKFNTIFLAILFTCSLKASTIGPLVIDKFDSVFLSFEKAIVTNDIVEVPVYIFSDDNINSLDLSFKLDTNRIKYISLVDHTNHIQYADFFNRSDSKLRFTSNSFKNYPKGSMKVVSFRFKVLKNSLTKEDFLTFNSYLNGDVSSNKIKGKDILNTNTNEVYEKFVKIIPNYTTNKIEITSLFQSTLFIYSINGVLVESKLVRKETEEEVDFQHYTKGLYIMVLKDFDGKIIKSNKLFKN